MDPEPFHPYDLLIRGPHPRYRTIADQAFDTVRTYTIPCDDNPPGSGQNLRMKYKFPRSEDVHDAHAMLTDVHEIVKQRLGEHVPFPTVWIGADKINPEADENMFEPDSEKTFILNQTKVYTVYKATMKGLKSFHKFKGPANKKKRKVAGPELMKEKDGCARIQDSATDSVLKIWLLSSEHNGHPYPTPQEQTALMEQTGMNKKQLDTWFRNARQRIWKPNLERSTKMIPAQTSTAKRPDPVHAPRALQPPSIAVRPTIQVAPGSADHFQNTPAASISSSSLLPSRDFLGYLSSKDSSLQNLSRRRPTELPPAMGRNEHDLVARLSSISFKTPSTTRTNIDLLISPLSGGLDSTGWTPPSSSSLEVKLDPEKIFDRPTLPVPVTPEASPKREAAGKLEDARAAASTIILRVMNANTPSATSDALKELVHFCTKDVVWNYDVRQMLTVEAGGIEAIGAAMRAYKNVAIVQMQALFALRKVASVKTLDRAGGFEAIVAAMEEHLCNAGVQEQAFDALITFPDYGVRAGSIKAIVAAMEAHGEVASVQERACCIIGSLAAINHDNKKAIAQAGGIEAVIAAMRLHLDLVTLQERALSAIKTVACNDDNRRLIARLGGIDAIVVTMKANRHAGMVQNQGCYALWTLAANNDNKKLIARAGGAEVIAAAMGLNTEEVGLDLLLGC